MRLTCKKIRKDLRIDLNWLVMCNTMHFSNEFDTLHFTRVMPWYTSVLVQTASVPLQLRRDESPLRTFGRARLEQRFLRSLSALSKLRHLTLEVGVLEGAHMGVAFLHRSRKDAWQRMSPNERLEKARDVMEGIIDALSLDLPAGLVVEIHGVSRPSHRDQSSGAQEQWAFVSRYRCSANGWWELSVEQTAHTVPHATVMSRIVSGIRAGLGTG